MNGERIRLYRYIRNGERNKLTFFTNKFFVFYKTKF